MELKRLNKKELTKLYQSEMVYDFPKSELKPLSGMLRLMDLDRYEPLLAQKDGEAVGYAIMWLPQSGEGRKARCSLPKRTNTSSKSSAMPLPR